MPQRSLAIIAALAMSFACSEPTRSGAAAASPPADTGLASSADQDSGSPPEDSAAEAGARADVARGPRPVPPPSAVPGAKRVVAIGDLHGDVKATRQALQLAGAIDANDTWIGGELIVVQVGDQLDRGDDEKAILLLLDSVAEQAWAAGGALYTLNGNHETMNVALQFKYVTKGGWQDFADTPREPNDPTLAGYPAEQRGRVAAFRPGGIYAMLLARHNTIQQVGDTVFVHGGLLPQHVSYGIDTINTEIQAWMRGEAKRPASTSGEDCPVWSRHYSSDVDAADCELAKETLTALGAKRIVVAHTVQPKGINAVCGGLVWRVDVGMAKHYGGKPQVLVIEGGEVSVLK